MVFPMLYITLHDIYFITGSLYLLISFPYFSWSLTPLASSKHQFNLYIYESVSAVLFFDSTCKWNHTVFVFVWLVVFSIIPSRSICYCKWQDFILFYCLSHIHCVCVCVYHIFLIHLSTLSYFHILQLHLSSFIFITTSFIFIYQQLKLLK